MLAGHVLWGVAVAALAAAGWRVAGRATPDPLERGVATAVLAAATAAAEALLLGRLGLAGTPVALAATAVLTWAAARRLVPCQRPSAGAQGGDRGEASDLRGAGGRGEAATAAPGPAVHAQPGRTRPTARVGGPWGVLALGAMVGALAALVAWMLRWPFLGIDSVAYHLTEIAIWVADGSTGATPFVGVDFPTGSYPLTNEVLLAWSAGLAQAFTPVAVTAGAQLALLVAAGRLGLRRLGVSPLAAALAVAAVATLPDVATGLNTAKNDLGALAWTVACGALCAAAPRRPALLAVAVLAAGLAIGTKTTVALQCVLVLAAGAVACRAVLRRHARVLVVAAVGAVAIGGVWYLRNLVEHGSPLWPLASGGDPVPPVLDRLDATFLDDPAFTLRGRTGLYVDALAGGLLVAPLGVLAWTIARRRAVAFASVATGLSLLAWARAPYTGRVADPILALNSVTTTRYLLPALATAALAVALVARRPEESPGGMREQAGALRGGAGRDAPGAAAARVATAVLGAAVLWNLAALTTVGFPRLPGAGTLLAGAVIGALAAAILHVVLRHRPALGAWVPVAAIAVVTVPPVLAVDGWTARHAATGATSAAPAIARLAADPAFADGDDPVAFAPETIGPLAGDRLRHPLELVPPDEPCARTRRRRGWVIVRRRPFEDRLTPFRAPACLRGRPPVLAVDGYRVHRLGR